MLKCYNFGTDIIVIKRDEKNIDSRKIKSNAIKNNNPNKWSLHHVSLNLVIILYSFKERENFCLLFYLIQL